MRYRVAFFFSLGPGLLIFFTHKPIPLVLLKEKDWKVWIQNFTFLKILEDFNLKKAI
jgi:hypothetical protein